MFARRIVSKPFVGRAFDFVKASQKVTTKEAKSEISKLKSLLDSIKADKARFTAPVADIDFAKYRELISSPGIVDALEKEYKNVTLPEFLIESNLENAKEVEDSLKEAREALATSENRIAELNKTLEELLNLRTGKDTTMEEVAARYPELAKEAITEIEQEQWDKSILEK
mmetsp:Transcript_11258/g.18393  ORF Transcript_11258/g.18393 Transcript_11258/m.18393 type:complete len:170 (-) Transcript_11258:38-547(-)